MKIAVISDIHGNVPALTAVIHHLAQWQPDQVVVNGDIINRGPYSLQCWQIIQQKQAEGWIVLKGNHEDYVAQHIGATSYGTDMQSQINQLSWWTYQQMGEEAVAGISRLPGKYDIQTPDDNITFIRHASIHSNRIGIGTKNDDSTVLKKITPTSGKPPNLFVTGHIHYPYIRQVQNSLVVNAGSVGQTVDTNPDASYAQLCWQKGKWQAQIARVPYDRQATKGHFHQSSYLPNAGMVAKLIYYEWWLARPVLYPWIHQYRDAVLAKEISLQKSVEHFLVDIC